MGNEYIFITDDIIKTVLREVNGKLTKSFEAFSKNWQQSSIRRPLMADVNKRVSDGAQNAVIQAYENSGIGKLPSYRYEDKGKKWHRFANKQMNAALRSRAFKDSDKDGIYFAKLSYLDRKAKQWYRLNFGASPRPQQHPPVVPMKFFGRVISKKIDLGDYPPSESFLIPAGAVFSSDFLAKSGKVRGVPLGVHGTSAMYVLGHGGASLKRVTKRDPKPSVFGPGKVASGIKGARFLEAGANYINENYGREVSEVAKKWFAEAKRKMR